MEPSTSAPGFHNIDPKSRQERFAANDKTALEKARIAARSTRSTPPPANVLVPEQKSPMYIDEHKRFADRDAAAAEYARKQENLSRKEDMYERKRADHYWKEKNRWDANEAVHNKVDARMAAKRDAGEGGTKRNASSENYNILTLDYAKNAAGQALAFKDESTRYKGELRAQFLYEKQHRTSHNLITGQPLPHYPAPQPPQRPGQ